MENIGNIVTWFITVIFNFFIFLKILNLTKLNLIKYVIGVIFSLLLAFLILIFNEYVQYFRYFLIIIFTSGFMVFITKTSFNTAITTSIISFGISYGIFLSSSFITSTGIVIIFGERKDILAILFAIFFQIVLFFILFKIKRFNKGITFLKKKSVGTIGVIISGIILFISIFLDREFSPESRMWILLGIALCITGFIIWWRRGLTMHYRKMVKERNIQELEKIIAEKDQIIEDLRNDNEIMARLIHRDNKLLPALSTAVLIYMDSGDDFGEERESIINQIDQLIEERAGVLKQSLTYNENMPSTKNLMIDGIIHHMMVKASEKGVTFKIAEISDLSGLTVETISLIKLYTLLTDLIENAIIATSESEYKHVLISVCSDNDVYEICVQDSGIPFTPETLMKLGVQRASTRLDRGGSGIGYITIFDILESCKAGLIITEYEPGESLFTKAITVRFAGESENVIKSYRADELHRLINENSDNNKCKFKIEINEG